ncbi:uncharacterized protein LOC118736122 [Rhagoletis pomonella]|uniref:uncharacterized protein LOC118736122 n=1 Tax=Rhagoletis pomonella TaxID=28610 RepID=UPI00177C0C62|nr:uncharacterized protein LOC118736122 [Rhagoletis pomonella]
MEIEDVLTLFNKFDTNFFGEMFKFKAGLKEWRNSMKMPLLCDRETLSDNSRIIDGLEKISSNLSVSRESTPSAQLPPVSSINKTRLINLLKSTVKGQMVLTYNEKYGYLDAKSQSTIAHCIVDRYVGNFVKMTYAEMQKWANAISEVFPKEKPL